MGTLTVTQPSVGVVYLSYAPNPNTDANVAYVRVARSDYRLDAAGSAYLSHQVDVVPEMAVRSFKVFDAGIPVGGAYSNYLLNETTAAHANVSQVSVANVTVSSPENWLLTSSLGDSISIPVADCSFKKPRQSEEFYPINSQYKTVGRGRVIGATGQLEVLLSGADPASTYASLRSLGNTTGQVYLKSPFGEVYGIDQGALTFEYVGSSSMKVGIAFTENSTTRTRV